MQTQPSATAQSAIMPTPRLHSLAVAAWMLLAGGMFLLSALLLTVATDWGEHKVPDLLLRYRLLDGRIAEYLRNALSNEWLVTARKLENEIRHRVQPGERVLLVDDPANPYWKGHAVAARFKYDLYPQPTLALSVEEANEQAKKEVFPCRLDWYSDSDITLQCNGFFWTNRPEAAR